MSADGNRVAFASTSTNLGGATSPKDDVYVRDLAAGTTTWASVPEDGDPAHSSARDPSISADGRRVAFTQELPEFGYGAIDEEEVFVRDLAAGTTTLASTGPAGPADTGAFESSLSGDGTKVTFISDARNLGGPLDRFRTAYVRDLVTGTTSVVAQGRSAEDVAVLSANGACVALQSSDLVAGYGPDFQHVFLHALGAGCAASGARPRSRHHRAADQPAADDPPALRRRQAPHSPDRQDTARHGLRLPALGGRPHHDHDLAQAAPAGGPQAPHPCGRQPDRLHGPHPRTRAAPRPLPRDRPRRRRRRQPLRAEARHVHGQAARRRASAWRRQRSVRSSSLKV